MSEETANTNEIVDSAIEKKELPKKLLAVPLPEKKPMTQDDMFNVLSNKFNVSKEEK